MFEDGLDHLHESNNTMLRFVNRRVDQIQQSMHTAMHDESMMDFMKLAVGMPMLGMNINPNQRLEYEFSSSTTC